MLFKRFLVGRIELDHGVHDCAVVVARAVIYLLFQAAERAEWFDAAILQVELSLGNVAGVVRDRMGHIIARHCGNG